MNLNEEISDDKLTTYFIDSLKKEYKYSNIKRTHGQVVNSFVDTTLGYSIYLGNRLHLSIEMFLDRAKTKYDRSGRCIKIEQMDNTERRYSFWVTKDLKDVNGRTPTQNITTTKENYNKIEKEIDILDKYLNKMVYNDDNLINDMKSLLRINTIKNIK